MLMKEQRSRLVVEMEFRSYQSMMYEGQVNAPSYVFYVFWL